MGISLKEQMDKATPNTLADKLSLVKIGSVLRAGKNSLYKQAPAASLLQLATLQSLALPTDAKAAECVRAYARAGAVTGELSKVAYGVTPATGEYAVAPNGDIVVLAADAITSLDVQYLAEKLDVFSQELPVVADVLTLPVVAEGTVLLMSVEVTAGASLGKKIILIPGGTPIAGQAALSVDKLTVNFFAGEATTAKITVGVIPVTDIETLLGADSQLQ
jgi:hypothetical protein